MVAVIGAVAGGQTSAIPSPSIMDKKSELKKKGTNVPNDNSRDYN
jgi:hypothetical protein